jgi:membrane protease YdiL (CAAX protease family)
VADAALPPIWSPGEGYALFVRGLGLPQALALAAFVVLRAETGIGSVVGIVSDLPLFVWVIGYLHARGSSMSEAFGLRPGRRAALLAAALSLIAAALLVDSAVVTASSYFDVKTHWTDGFAEQLLWASPRRVALETFDASVWAPIVEEILFRGLLYGTLRTRLPMWPSAIASAAIFTVPHGYALAGSASVFASGLLWAIAYERTRSLLPGLIAHFANNALSTIWTLAMLR